MKKKNKQTFILDIGTRSIIGLLMEENEQGVCIKEIICKEHGDQAMLDGQIHNIPKVSSLLKEVKIELEKKTGIKLKKVAVAAAGRTLKTIKTTIYIDLDNYIQISYDDVLNLELKGARKAQALLVKQEKDIEENEYYCVGYSVTKYYLDNNLIGNLIGQKGNRAGLEIVAAFLPKVVVDSLQTVLKENGLVLEKITLEPIAAINAILPVTMRKLNIALVDIGAGTSDIAISSDGTITGYGMVSIAGDEITETLCEKYLLDFNEGELLKRKLHINLDEYLSFCDILGIKHNLKGSDIVASIGDTTKLLAQKISNEIMNLNNNSPQAVILIGGGSLTPYISDYIAIELGLSKERVAVQMASAIKDVYELPPEFQGPEIITPIGIGLTAIKHLTLSFIPVQINNYSINLLNLKKNTVLDALLALGIDTGKLYGKPGLAMTVEINGSVKAFPGTMGNKAVIKVNGKVASLDTFLKAKDKIQYIPAQDGLLGKGWVKDLLDSQNWIMLNGEKKYLPWEIIINGISKHPETELKDGDKVFVREIYQIGELFDIWEMDELKNPLNITVFLNDLKKKISVYSFKIICNGKEVSLYDNLVSQDEIIIKKEEVSNYSVSEIMEKYLVNLVEIKQLTVKANEQLVKFPILDYQITINGFPGSLNSVLKHDDVVEINSKSNENPILIDIFTKINFSPNPPSGKSTLEVLINGKEAEYITVLNEGDNISLNWK